MKKWLLALMICLSFSTLTVGIFLLPQTINTVYQREQNAEEDNNVNGNVIVPVDPGGGGGSSTPASLSLTIMRTIEDGSSQNWYNCVPTVQARASTSASWSTYSNGGGGGSSGMVGWHWNLYVGYYVRFKANCNSGYAVWEITNSSGTRVWPSGDGYYYFRLTSTTDSYTIYGLAGYMVSVNAGSHGTVKPNSSAPTMSSFSGGIKSGATIYSSTYNWYPSGSWSTTIDAYAVADSGYKFSSWSQNPSGSTMTANRTITANFVKDADTTNPVIHRSTYVQNGSVGYNVYVYATDNVGINRVQFPTWTTYNGQDDIQSSWGDNSAASGTSGSWTVNGLSYNYKYYISVSSHNNEYGPYNTHIYAYDAAGNVASSGINGITFSFTLTANANGGSIPSTSGWTGTGSTATKTLTYGDAYGTLPTPTRVNYVFNGWYTAASGGVYVTTSRTMGAGNQYIYAHWTFAVEVYFITEGPGDFVDNGCIYSWDTSGDNELVVYFDYNDDIDISWDGLDMAYINIHGGDGGSFEIGAGYYFTGDVEIDYDGTVQDYNLDNGISFCCGDSALNHIYVYFYTYKYVSIGRNNTSYGTVSQSQVRVSGSTTYSISSSGSTVTINGTSVTATPAASTTGFTYAFGSWTIPSGYASQSFPTITANFTRTTNTRSVTLAVRTISKSGGVSSSNTIPSGASLAVNYTNSTPTSTSSSQTSASTAYTIQAGTSMTITPAVPAGYKYVGYNTSASKPSVSSFPTSSTITPSNGSTYYFFFQEIAAPLYYTTERGGYWYYEDGEYPQTYIGPTLSGTSTTSSKFKINGTDYTVYTANGSKYIQVASPMTGSIKLNNGTTVSLTAGTKYWFRIDPIRWRVSNYGASASKYSFSSVTANLVGVSDILGHGRIHNGIVTTGQSPTPSSTSGLSNYMQDCSAVGYTNAAVNLIHYTDSLAGDNTSTKVLGVSDTTQQKRDEIDQLIVATIIDIQNAAHNGIAQDNLKTYASDLSAMLQCRDYNNSTGWTSSIYNQGSGVTVGPGASYMGKYWANTDNVFGFVYIHQASDATCLGTR